MKKGFSISGRLGITALVLVLIVITAIGLRSCSRGSYSGRTERLTLASVPTELNALVCVAVDQKIFARNGLEITLKEYDSGAAAAAGMLNAEADIALAAEFPIVRQVFNKKEIVSFGTVARYENTYIIWRTDSGVATLQGLKGKKIGVTLSTISEFYLGRTLELNGIHVHEVTLVDTKAVDCEKALVDGEVDAVVTWEPWVNQIHRRMGKEVITQAAQGAQFAYWNLVSTIDWTTQHPDTIERLMKSLLKAEGYIVSYQDNAKSIVRKWMKFDYAYLETIWPRYQFSLSLDQSLISAMEDEARWLIKNNLTTEKTVPDFIESIFENALKGLKPEAVNIIR